MAMLKLEDVDAGYGAFQALFGISMTVEPGEAVAVIGANGAGKTTLLRTLAGLQAPSEGAIVLGGRDVRTMPACIRARSISYLAQDSAVSWPLGVAALVSLGRLPHRGASAADNAGAVRRALAATGSTELAERSFGTLSGGERARVLLARALAVEAPILLADEPVAALDPYHQLQIMDMLRAIARRGTAVVAVLHDLALAYRFADRVALLSRGRKMADGLPDDVLSDANLAAHFAITARRGPGYIVPWQRSGIG